MDPVALVACTLAAVAYLLAVRRVHRAGGVWRSTRTIAFLLLGLGSFLVVTSSVLGVYAGQLRWAFTTRIALLLLAVPPAIAAGRPVALLRAASGPRLRAGVERMLGSRPFRLVGTAVFGALFSAAVFALFLTPLAGWARETPGVDDALTLLVPLAGLATVLPLAEDAESRSSLFIVGEFLLVFGELVIDAIPGILLRLSGTVLDGTAAVHSALPWWPSPLRDQQLAGDLLWFIAEAADVPIIVLLLLRWARSDRREASSFDELTDEQYDALVGQHLRGHDPMPEAVEPHDRTAGSS